MVYSFTYHQDVTSIHRASSVMDLFVVPAHGVAKQT